MVVTIPLLIPLQGPAPEGEAGDPLHEVVELGVGPEGARVERVTELGGTLHVWVSSDAFDPRLQVELPGRNVVLEDGDSGGGTTAWLSLELAGGTALTAVVLPTSEGTGAAALHLVTCPETEATRKAAQSAWAELDEIARLREAGHAERAAQHVAAVIEELGGVEGAADSVQVARVLWRAGVEAHRLSAPQAALRAWGAVLARW